MRKRSSCDSGSGKVPEYWTGFWQVARLAFDRHLALGHRLEQRALRLRRGAVDLVGQQQLAEHRAGVKAEGGLVLLVDRHADDVRRQQVAGELDAVVLEAEHARHRVGQRGLAHAGQVLDQQVPSRQQASQRDAHLRLLADQHGADRVDDRLQFLFCLAHAGAPFPCIVDSAAQPRPRAWKATIPERP